MHRPGPRRPTSTASRPYADEDGYTLDAPTRYSIADWWLNLRNLPSSAYYKQVQGHLVANTFSPFSCRVSPTP